MLFNIQIILLSYMHGNTRYLSTPGVAGDERMRAP